MIPTSFPPKEEIARLSARMLLEVKAVHFSPDEPFTLASGLPSPTYIDCRKLISYPRIRSTLMDFLTVTVMRNGGCEAFDNIAGGEYPVSRSLYYYIKAAHVGVVPGIQEYATEFASEAAAGEEGYLGDKGLIPLPADRFEANAAAIAGLTPMTGNEWN